MLFLAYCTIPLLAISEFSSKIFFCCLFHFVSPYFGAEWLLFWSSSPILCQLLLILFRITVKIAQLVQRSGEKPRRNTDAGSSPRCGIGFFSHCQLPVQTLSRCSCAIACINVCAHVKNCSHTIVWTQRNTAHTDSNG